jgi:hypothetical protein
MPKQVVEATFRLRRVAAVLHGFHVARDAPAAPSGQDQGHSSFGAWSLRVRIELESAFFFNNISVELVDPSFLSLSLSFMYPSRDRYLYIYTQLISMIRPRFLTALPFDHHP